MKFIIVFVALFAFAVAGPVAENPKEVTILRSESDVGPEKFSYSYETSDGAAAQAEGELKNAGSENEAISVKGSYRFTADDGQTYEVVYIADENGFQPSGAHLPHN